MAAIGAVVEYFYAEDSREIMVNGKKAVIYTFPNKEYLCWTLSPEDSCVIEYVPGTLHEADIIMIAESVGWKCLSNKNYYEMGLKMSILLQYE